MLDDSLRELERALRESPRDAALAERYLQVLRRAGRVASEAPPGTLEGKKDAAIAVGDHVLVARRSRPRRDFVWLASMDGFVGKVGRVVRRARDGLSVVVDLSRGEVWPGEPARGCSFGLASLVRLP